ncbi:hypothetical protein SLA2020_087330 [Shorea laevis]
MKREMDSSVPMQGQQAHSLQAQVLPTLTMDPSAALHLPRKSVRREHHNFNWKRITSGTTLHPACHSQAANGTSDQVSDAHALSVEDTFKLTAGETNLWLLTCT